MVLVHLGRWLAVLVLGLRRIEVICRLVMLLLWHIASFVLVKLLVLRVILILVIISRLVRVLVASASMLVLPRLGLIAVVVRLPGFVGLWLVAVVLLVELAWV